MASDIAELMRVLGHRTFAVVGHDRGAYVGLRIALDHAHATTHLVILDAVPIGEALARATATFAERWWHWFFFGQPDKPERAILADPEAWYQPDPDSMGAGNFEDLRRAIHDPPSSTRCSRTTGRASASIEPPTSGTCAAVEWFRARPW